MVSVHVLDAGAGRALWTLSRVITNAFDVDGLSIDGSIPDTFTVASNTIDITHVDPIAPGQTWDCDPLNLDITFAGGITLIDAGSGVTT